MPRAPSLDIAVVGAGTAGSAAAVFLSRAGHAVTLYERVPEPSAVGAGIVLQPTGLAVLGSLGLREPVLAHAERLRRLWCTTAKQRTVVDLSYELVSPDAFGLGLHRGVLFRTLFDAARRETGVTVCTGLDLEDLDEGPRGVTLVERGVRRRYGPYDLVVVCNGARSSVRDDTALHKTVTKYPWGALWAVVPQSESQTPFQGVLRQVVDGTHTLIGLLPTGRAWQGRERLVSLFYSLRADRLDDFRRRDFSEWKQQVATLFPETEGVLAQLNDTTDLVFSEYHDVVMWPWNTGRVVYLGDAAHATSPQLGQGCNLALVDAWVLSECLDHHESVFDALYAYSRARRSHLRWYQFVTRWLTPFFQSDAAVLGHLRDALFGPSLRVPFVKRQMVEGMAGISRGPWPWASPLSLPK